MNSEGRRAVRVQVELADEFSAWLMTARVADPAGAALVHRYVRALRSECAARRQEARELGVRLAELEVET